MDDINLERVPTWVWLIGGGVVLTVAVVLLTRPKPTPNAVGIQPVVGQPFPVTVAAPIEDTVTEPVETNPYGIENNLDWLKLASGSVAPMYPGYEQAQIEKWLTRYIAGDYVPASSSNYDIYNRVVQSAVGLFGEPPDATAPPIAQTI